MRAPGASVIRGALDTSGERRLSIGILSREHRDTSPS